MIKKLLFIFFTTVMLLFSHSQARISFRSTVAGTTISFLTLGACATSVLVYLTKKLQNKYVPRNEQLSDYYIRHDCYLHLFVQNNTETQTKKACIMYLHGIGGHNREMRTLLSKEQQHLLDYADYIIPCIEFTNNADVYFAPFFNTDFGQEQDLLTVLNALKNLFLKHSDTYDKLILMGRSRGGAITTNLIGVLSTKGHYLLEKSRISESERLIILEKLVAGGVIFSVPLISLEHALQKRCGTYLGSLLYKTVFSKITRDLYQPTSALKPLTMIQQWSYSKIPVFVIMATDDNIVGTKYNEQFLQDIETYNGIKPTVVYITGGHKSPHIYTESVTGINHILFGNTL